MNMPSTAPATPTDAPSLSGTPTTEPPRQATSAPTAPGG
jgi:hypothetical protein